ncbi:ABC transporter ATP-binding protein [Alphaproteobacteria bacterium KMM 3653]|uniref:ABC transporter ATP-binding protein n=1 Tax=Harenicola maris TaxID=2841044 RepID=A0AAP2G7U6_9RHOB|nr:ABC transporter ATP-binding protein [Harenicola maris]
MTKPLLEIQNLSKNFSGLDVIRDVTFHVNEGERMALIGPNGAGKTTMFNLITGVYPVSQGSIRMAGEDITTASDRSRAQRGIIRTFQNIRLMPHLTAAENVMLGQTCHSHGIWSWLAPVGLQSSRSRKEADHALEVSGLLEYRDMLTYDLPYGVQKRIELARALSAKPKLILLDEPAAGLNPSETDDLAQQLLDISASGVTLLTVEHDMHFVRRLSQRVIVLNFGSLIAEGTAAEVQNDQHVLEAYLGSDRKLEEEVAT